jgi:hypothetical protein
MAIASAIKVGVNAGVKLVCKVGLRGELAKTVEKEEHGWERL